MRGLRIAGKLLAWIVGAAIAVPVALVLAVLVFANIPAGQRLIAREIGPLSAGLARVSGLSGRFPDALRVAHVTLHDPGGDWLTINDIRLDWSPLRLISRLAQIDDLTVGEIHVLRLPQSAPAPAPAKPASSTPFGLPVRVAVERLRVEKLAIDPPVADAAAALRIAGSAHLATLQQGDLSLDVTRLDGPGHYAVSGKFDAAHIKAALEASEPAGGLVASLGHLPALGALAVHATVDGPRSAEATHLTLAAGPLRAAADGTVDIVGQSADLAVTASAPPMAPRADTSWQSVAIDAHVHGPFTKPDASGHVAVAGLKAGGAAIDRFEADIAGNQGQVTLKASIAGLVIPGPKPDLLQASPLLLSAQARLDTPDRPVTFSLAHPLIAADGTAQTGGALAATLHLRLPDLAPFAAIGGIDLHGSTDLTVQAAERGAGEQVAIDGGLALTGGMAQPVALIGPGGKIGTTIALDGGNITISRFDLAGKALHLTAHGTDNGGALDVDYALDLPDMTAVVPTVNGTVGITGHAQGQQTDLAVTTDIKGDLGAPGVPRAPVTAHLALSGLPGAPQGDVTAAGAFDGAPLSLAVHASRAADGGLTAEITRADWRSLHAEGKFTLPKGATLPLGQAELRMTRLDDLRPVIGQAVSGSVQATIALDTGLAKLNLEARDAGLPGDHVGRATVTATVRDPLGNAAVDAQANIDGIAAAGIGGQARITVTGPKDAIGIRLAAGLTGLAGSDAKITGAASVNVTAKQATLSALSVDWHDEPVRLLAPVRVSFGDGVSVDRLRIGIRQATLDLAGRITPKLDLTAGLHNLTADLAKPFAPSLAADGSASVDAKLAGSLAAPTGTVRLRAAGIRMRSGPGRSLPPATLAADLDLAGTSARVDARLAAGSTHLAVTGTAPLSAGGPMNLHATGAVDLALSDPILTASGRRMRGNVTLDATATGAPTAPRIAGSVRLANGEFQDYAQGAHLTNIAAEIDGTGDTIRIARFTAQAGPGTISASGTVGTAAPMPVDLTLTMRDARPLSSDLLTAELDADLTLRGQVAGALAAGGTVRIRRADIRVPDKLPTSVAVLNVRDAGAPPPPAPSPGPNITLDVTVSASQAIFIRGHGLDAEMAGRLHVGGTASAPEPSGGFKMREGTFSLAGTTLTFTTGEIGFDGSGLRRKIDPTLNFLATSTTSNITASLAVTGYADAPKFALTSVPELPQDEVLSQLLFGRSARDLGPFEYAEIAQALAQLSGVGGSASDPLNSVRQGLGLDRLAVGTDAAGGPTLQGGRYIARGVYLGAQQGAGGDTAGNLQIDLYKGLKLQTTVGSSASGGSSLGLTYQFQY